MELQAKYEGRSRCVDVTLNDDGTFTFTIVATAGGGNTELTFTADPFFTFDLNVYEDPQVRNQRGEVLIKQIPFQLEIVGHIKPDADKIFFTQRMVSSPYGDGKDECGRPLRDPTKAQTMVPSLRHGRNQYGEIVEKESKGTNDDQSNA